VNTQSSTKIDTRFAGYQVGLDGALLNVGNSGWNAHLGVTAGDVEAKSSDAFSSVNFTSARFYGVYAVFTRGAFFSDIGYRHTSYDAEVTSSIANLSKTPLKGRGDNLNASAGYQFRFGDNFIEPSAGISVTRSTFDNIGSTVFGNPYTLTFNELKSTLARIGVRAGFTSVVNNTVALSPFVTGSVWHEFEQNAGGQFIATVPLTTVTTLTTDRVGTFYQAGAGVSAQVLGTGFLAFIRTDFRAGDKLDGASIHGGARYTFGP
jgi:outer membrane autotransporter protein